MTVIVRHHLSLIDVIVSRLIITIMQVDAVSFSIVHSSLFITNFFLK